MRPLVSPLVVEMLETAQIGTGTQSLSVGFCPRPCSVYVRVVSAPSVVLMSFSSPTGAAVKESAVACVLGGSYTT